MFPSQCAGHRANFAQFHASALGVEQVLYDFKPVAKYNLGAEWISHARCLMDQAKEEKLACYNTKQQIFIKNMGTDKKTCHD